MKFISALNPKNSKKKNFGIAISCNVRACYYKYFLRGDIHTYVGRLWI